MIQVKNNEIIQTELPSSGYLKNGESVSGYNYLPQDVLVQEGWLPSEDNKPIYDETTQILQVDSYDIQADKVIVNYVAVVKPTDIYDYALGELGV